MAASAEFRQFGQSRRSDLVAYSSPLRPQRTDDKSMSDGSYPILNPPLDKISSMSAVGCGGCTRGTSADAIATSSDAGDTTMPNRRAFSLCRDRARMRNGTIAHYKSE